MAITNHLVAGNSSDYFNNITVGDTYTEASQTANSDTTGLAFSVSGSGVDTSVIGSHNVIYSANDDDGIASVIQETVMVAAVSYPVDPEDFVMGDIDRYGNDLSGTVFELTAKLMDSGAITELPVYQSALFDENAYDPYETEAARKLIP